MKRNFFIFLVATSLSATATTFENGMYYVNEGWYGHDNGSITWISDEGDVVYRADHKANGDAAQLGATSCYGQVYGDNLYVTSKQDNRLVVFDAATLQTKATFTELGGDGRGVLGVNDEKVYVGTSAGISVLNEQSMTISGMVEGTAGYDIGMMQRVGKRIFAATYSDKILVIDPVADKVTDEIEASSVSGFTVSRNGMIWANCGSTILRINPLTLVTASFEISNSLPSQWYAWKADPFCASYVDDALYYAYGGSWSQNKIGKLKILDDDTLEEDASFAFTCPEGETSTTEFYGVLQMNPHTNQLVAQTVQSGYGSNYTYNWVLFVDAETSAVAKSIKLTNDNGEGYYWFPEMPVFTDDAMPELALSDYSFTSLEAETINVASFLNDNDNLSVTADVDVVVSDEDIATVDFDGLNLTVTPLCDGSTSMVVKANSNGKIVEKTVNIAINTGGAVKDFVASSARVYLAGKVLHIDGFVGKADVYNAMGARVAEVSVVGNSTVSLANCACGAYIVRLSNGDTFKVVIVN